MLALLHLLVVLISNRFKSRRRLEIEKRFSVHTGRVKRRELITLLGGAAAWPLRARAQQPAVPPTFIRGLFAQGPNLASYRGHVSRPSLRPSCRSISVRARHCSKIGSAAPISAPR